MAADPGAGSETSNPGPGWRATLALNHGGGRLGGDPGMVLFTGPGRDPTGPGCTADAGGERTSRDEDTE